MTEHENTERALRNVAAQERARRAELAAVMEAIPAAVFVVHDALCLSMTANQFAHDLLRVPPGRDISKSAPPDKAPHNFEVYASGKRLAPEELPLQSAVASGKPVMNAELELRFDDGGRRTLFGNALPLFEEDGRLRGGVGAFADITAYTDLLEQLKQAGEKMDQFVAMLGHELRSPLAAIQNAIAVVARAESPENRAWADNVIARQIAQVTALVRDLDDVTQIKRGKLLLIPDRIDLASVIESAVAACEPLIAQCQRQLVTSFPRPLPVDGDAVRLQQVFVNLLNNAVKFTTEGGEIRVTAEQCGSDAVVMVRDNGLGISAADLPRVFDLYFQAGPRIGSSRGFGIGLGLVKHFVELHSGTVEVRSSGPGTGTEVIVTLPLAQAARHGDALRPQA